MVFEPLRPLVAVIRRSGGIYLGPDPDPLTVLELGRHYRCKCSLMLKLNSVLHGACVGHQQEIQLSLPECLVLVTLAVQHFTYISTIVVFSSGESRFLSSCPSMFIPHQHHPLNISRIITKRVLSSTYRQYCTVTLRKVLEVFLRPFCKLSLFHILDYQSSSHSILHNRLSSPKYQI